MGAEKNCQAERDDTCDQRCNPEDDIDSQEQNWLRHNV
jgi:hypothetical protein